MENVTSTKPSIKFDQIEIDSIKSLQEKYQEKLIIFGHLNLERLAIEQAIKALADAEADAKKQYLDLQKEETDLIEKITTKYGEGNLSLKDGTFVPK